MSYQNKEILEKVVDYASKQGANGSDVILDKSDSLNFKALNGKLEEYKVSSSQVVGIRVIKDNKSGVSYSESFDEDALKYMVDQALANASYAKEDETEQISVKNSKALECDCLGDEQEISTDAKVEFALALESEVKLKGDNVKSSPYNGFNESSGSRMILNSEGTFCVHRSKYYSCYTSALLEQNGKNSMYWGSNVARSFSELDRSKVINKAYNTANDLLDGAPIKTGNYQVIFEHEAFSEISSVFAGMFSAKQAIYGINPMKDKIGKQVAHESITIVDNPLYKEGLGYSLFDDEGSQRKEVTLIENGILKTFLHNTSTAKTLKTQNTFSASRSTRDSLGVAGTHTFISKGKTSESDLFNGEVFEIIKLDGLHSGTDFVSGDFSCGASGYLLKDGQRVQTVKGVTISGNYYKMLLNIEAIGDSIRVNDYKSFYSPLIRFNGLTVAGN